MPEWNTDDRERWALSQLSNARIEDAIAGPVRRLLALWWGMNFNERRATEILEVFTKLALQQALETPAEQEFDWVQAKPGQIIVGEVVRVKHDAYRGLASKHNGRVGRIVAIRSGDIIVNSIDTGPKIEGAHHAPIALEKRIPRP
jgi:hypothetical protein